MANSERRERLLVLSGGVEPCELFRVKGHVSVSGPNVGRDESKSGPSDVVFTDVGLLLAAYDSPYDYNRKTPRDGALPPIERFEIGATFLPADEIVNFRSEVYFYAQFNFRRKYYLISVTPELAAAAGDARQWLLDARQKRVGLNGGPEEGGLEALEEWGRRLDEPAHEWVAAAIKRMLAGPRLSMWQVLRRKVGPLSALVQSLLRVKTEDSLALAARLTSARVWTWTTVSGLSAVFGVLGLIVAGYYYKTTLPPDANPTAVESTSWVFGFCLALSGFAGFVWGLVELWKIWDPGILPVEHPSQVPVQITVVDSRRAPAASRQPAWVTRIACVLSRRPSGRPASRLDWQDWGTGQMLPCPYCAKKMERARSVGIMGGGDLMSGLMGMAMQASTQGGTPTEQTCDHCARKFESRLCPDAMVQQKGLGFHQWRPGAGYKG